MSIKSLLTLALVVLIPLAAYFIVSRLSKSAVVMPRHFYADTVIETERRGRMVSDTVWHKVADFKLQNQFGDTVSLSQLAGKIVVADFFFTRCPNPCPTLTRSMKKVQESFMHSKVKVDQPFVHFLSFSVDPEYDSVPVLRRYADKYNVNGDRWWMLTGKKADIYNHILQEFKLPAEGDTTGGVKFIHSSRFVLLDRDHSVRGYYDGEDSVSMARLTEDIVLLMLEKDRKKKSAIFGD